MCGGFTDAGSIPAASTIFSIALGFKNKAICTIAEQKANWQIIAIGSKRSQFLSRTQKCRSMFSTIEDGDHLVPHIDFSAQKIFANPAKQFVI